MGTTGQAPTSSNSGQPPPSLFAADTVRTLTDKNSGFTIFLPAKINGHDCSAIIDTAAQVSVISTDTMTALNLSCDRSLPKIIRTVESGATMNCYVVPNVVIVVGSHSYVHDIVTGNFADPLILGLDFLLKFNCIIDIPNYSITLNDYPTKCWIQKNSPTGAYYISQVIAAEDLKIPPCSSILVPVEVLAPPGTILSTSPRCLPGLLIPSVTFVARDSETFIEVTNDSCSSEQLKAGTLLTDASEVSEIHKVQQVSISDSRSSSSETPIHTSGDGLKKPPPHLSDLFTDASSRLNSEESHILCQLLCDFGDVFSAHKNDLGQFTEITHRIETYDEAPTKEKLRRTPIKFQHEEEKTLNDMLDNGVIQPSTSEWASAPVLVRKKSGEVRYTVDFRKLNSKTRKDAYPLPLISECTDTLSGSVWFHTLDLNSGYWQILVEPEDRHKTAFLTKFGLFEHVRMAQGLCNAPATFQRVMNLVLRGLIWNIALVYLDDVIVLGLNFQNGLENLQGVLERFRQYKLKLKPKKCTLFGSEVVFLGRHVSKNGVSVTQDHVQSVLNWPKPSNSTEASKFLGFINYHREFIPGLAGIARPLYQLTKPKSAFEWTDECDVAFNRLKECITTTPVLSFPNPLDPFILDTDASDHSVGAALYQLQEGREVPIGFSSMLLTPEQRKYCTTRRELLAIVAFTRHFRHYLLGQEFVVRTDHSSLSWLYRFRDPSGQLGRWLEELSQYNLKIQHRNGNLHSNADGLSRVPSGMKECNCYLAGKELSSLPCGGCKYCTRLHSQWAKFETEVDYVVPLAIRSLDEEEEGATSLPRDDPFFPTYSNEELRKHQLDDKDISPVINWLEELPPPSEATLMLQSPCTKALWRNRDTLTIKDGVLHHKWYGIDNTHHLQLVVPHDMKEEILEALHDRRILGHLGMNKTYNHLKRSFFWPFMKSDVEIYVNSCGTCRRNKHQKSHRSPLQHFQAGAPGERVHIDFLGPFPETPSGKKLIMVMIDQFTKWVELAALSDQTALSTAMCFFEQWVVRFGTPTYVHTDQGRNFTSDLFIELCNLLQITKTRTTPYRPSSNGQVERVNQTILAFIRCFLEDKQTEWDAYLPALGMSLRATVNRSTGFTPNMLRLGQEVSLPTDVMFGLSPLKLNDSHPAPFLRNLQKKLHLTFAETRSRLALAHKAMKKNYDSKAHSPPHSKFEVGDLVYLENSASVPGDCKKLLPLLKGPYIVKEIVSDFLYLICDRKGDSVRHRDKLHLCEDRTIPSWALRLRARTLHGPEHTPPLDEEEAPHQLDWLFTEEEPPEHQEEPQVEPHEHQEPQVEPQEHQEEPESTTNEAPYEPEDSSQELQEEVLHEPKFTRRGRPIKVPQRFLD